MNNHKTILFTLLIFAGFLYSGSAMAQDFQEITINREIMNVQPMTGIVFWPGNSNIETDAISLEFSYMLYNSIVTEKGVYDWTPVEELLDEMASRNHQAVLRFRFTYPGRQTTVPEYIKALPDYEEIEGITEGNETMFPDWRHPELREFTIDFYRAYAERYDKDPRLAFVQTGFGLWAEYHIYDGPFELGRTFPSKAFQEEFFYHLDTVFSETYWSISIDAASDTYSPFEEKPELKEINFGLFDDSFMHKGHAGYNTSSWTFFDRERYKWTPAGGEFSYYTTYDQQNVLNEHVGAHGIPFEIFVENFHMSYINGNDQARYQTLDRVKEASMYMGYRFKINNFMSKDGASVVEVENVGVAPIYYDAYISVNGVRSATSLRFLQPGDKLSCEVAAGGSDPELTIESDRILETQTIEYYGTVNEPYRYVQPEITPLNAEKELPSGLAVRMDSQYLYIQSKGQQLSQVALYQLNGTKVQELTKSSPEGDMKISRKGLKPGIYVMRSNIGSVKILIPAK